MKKNTPEFEMTYKNCKKCIYEIIPEDTFPCRECDVLSSYHFEEKPDKNQQWAEREQKRAFDEKVKELKAAKKQIKELEEKYKWLNDLNDRLGKSIDPIKKQKDEQERLLALANKTIDQYKVKLGSARMYLCSMLEYPRVFTKETIAENFEKYDLDFTIEEDKITIRRIKRAEILHSGQTPGEAEGKSH